MRNLGTHKGFIHVIPINDTQIHCADQFCTCMPLEDEKGAVVHHAKGLPDKGSIKVMENRFIENVI